MPDPILQCSRLCRSFRMGTATVDVLRDVDFQIHDGEFVAIEGRSGSGKSTLLHLLAGLDTPDGGTIHFDGRDLADLARRSTRHTSRVRGPLNVLQPLFPLLSLAFVATDRAGRELSRVRNERFGFVFQFYHLLPELTVLENAEVAAMVNLSRRQFRRQRRTLAGRATGILESLGLGHRLKHRPAQLSGGERQRVAIARALMNQPRVLFADEPTGNLDAETGGQIMAVLEGLHREHGQTIVMVTHDRTIARRADRLVVLKGGRVESNQAVAARVDHLHGG